LLNEEKDKIIDAEGRVYVYHNIIFQEEVNAIARDRMKDKEKTFE